MEVTARTLTHTPARGCDRITKGLFVQSLRDGIGKKPPAAGFVTSRRWGSFGEESKRRGNGRHAICPGRADGNTHDWTQHWWPSAPPGPGPNPAAPATTTVPPGTRNKTEDSTAARANRVLACRVRPDMLRRIWNPPTGRPDPESHRSDAARSVNLVGARLLAVFTSAPRRASLQWSRPGQLPPRDIPAQRQSHHATCR